MKYDIIFINKRIIIFIVWLSTGMLICIIFLLIGSAYLSSTPVFVYLCSCNDKLIQNK